MAQQEFYFYKQTANEYTTYIYYIYIMNVNIQPTLPILQSALQSWKYQRRSQFCYMYHATQFSADDAMVSEIHRSATVDRPLKDSHTTLMWDNPKFK